MDEKLKKLIESLEEIEGSLDNVYYSLPEYDLIQRVVVIWIRQE